MRLEYIGKTKAKLVNVNVLAQKLGQTELRPAISLRFKVTSANDILNQLDPKLRPFLYEKNSAAQTQGALDGVPVVSDLPALTQAAQKIGALGWDDEQTGCKLHIYQGATGHGDIKLKDGTVDKVKIEPHDGGTVDVFFDFYAADLDAETMGEIAVLHQHEMDIELTAPELVSKKQKDIDPETPEGALAKAAKKDAANADGKKKAA